MKSRAWFIKFPGDFYALGPVRFDDPVNEKEVREWTRDWEKIKKLPVGFQCWPEGRSKKWG